MIEAVTAVAARLGRLGAAALRSRSLARALPLALAGVLLWPIFLPRYQLIGGASFELLMLNGLKAAFHQALLRGELPLWNEWVASGKVFAPFGAVPVSVFTPLELLVDLNVGKHVYAAELLLAHAAVAWMLLWLCRWLGVGAWIAAPGFFAYFLIEPMPYFTHWVFWAGCFVFGAALVTLLALHLVTERDRLLLPALASGTLLAPGVRPDAFPALLLFLASATGLALVWGLAAGRGRRALVAFARRLAAFVLLPLAFYAWQVPLVLATARVSESRLWHVETPLAVTIQHLATAVALSGTARLGAAWAIAALGIVLVARFGPGSRAVGRTRRTDMVALVAGAALLAGALRALGAVTVTATGVSVFMAGAIAFHGFPPARIRSEAVGVAVRLRPLWGYPAVAAAIHGLFEGMSLDAVLHLPWKLSLAFVALVVCGAMAGFGDEAGTLKARLSRALVLLLAIAWLWRDFLSLPLYEIANIVWPGGRDFVITSPLVTGLFVIGADAVARRGVGALLGHPHPGLRTAARVALAVLALPVAVTLAFVFYVPKAEWLDTGFWRHVSDKEMRRHEQRLRQRTDLAALVRREHGPDARILTQLMDHIGFPGTAAGAGARDAWGYDYVPDAYRELAERAFGAHDDLASLPRNVPRLIYYNRHAGAVYRQDFRRYRLSPEETAAGFEQRLARMYLRLQVLKGGPEADPFFLELMRVGGLMLAHGAPARLDRLDEIEPDRNMALWGRPVAYRFRPERPLRRIGFLPAGAGDDGAAVARLAGHARGDLADAYARVTLTPEEDAAAGTRLVTEGRGANHERFVVDSRGPGVLVIFDAWHPDWRATVNGRPAPVERAFVALRAVPVPAGHSIVELAFEPAGWRLGVAASLLALVAAGGWGLALARREQARGK